MLRAGEPLKPRFGVVEPRFHVPPFDVVGVVPAVVPWPVCEPFHPPWDWLPVVPPVVVPPVVVPPVVVPPVVPPVEP